MKLLNGNYSIFMTISWEKFQSLKHVMYNFIAKWPGWISRVYTSFKVCFETLFGNFMHKLNVLDCNWWEHTVGLKMSETIKINDHKITTYFWYLWTFLSRSRVKFFWFVFGFQVALQSFLLKVRILRWNFLWTIFLCKRSILWVWKAIFCLNGSSTKNFSSKFQL